MKSEKGVMIMKGGLAWGITYEDGHSTSYGWVPPEVAPIHDPRFCKKPIDATHDGSPYISELKKGKVVRVERITKVKIK